MPNVDISDHTIARLQKHAKPLIDSFDSVIERLLDSYEAANNNEAAPAVPQEGVTEFAWNNPPVLAHTTVTQVVLNGVKFAKGDCYWNTVMYAVVRLAHKQGKTAQQIHEMLTVNAVVGAKHDNGYKFLPDVGISIQGQNSDGASRQAFEMASAMGIKLEVSFRWQNKEEAAFANRSGVFSI